MRNVESKYGLLELKLDESAGENQSWIQIFPLGTYSHPLYGKIKLTSERFARFIKNFNDRVRDIDLDIDYDHKAKTEKAAGWVRELADRGADGLWGLIDWTPPAYQALKDKEYRYFSPEFSDTWVHPKSGQKYMDVLFGGALTNRPHLKDIQPINLSESGQIPEGDNMDKVIQALSELLGVELSDEDSEEVISQKLSEAVKGLKEKPAPKDDEDGKLKKLAETNPEIAQLLADREEDRRRLSILEASNRLSEVSRQLSDTSSEKYALPPSFTDVVKKQLSALPIELSEGFITALKDLTKTGLVQLGEAPAGDPNNRKELGDLVDQFHTEVEKLTEGENGMAYTEALMKVATEKPELFDAYENQQVGARNA